MPVLGRTKKDVLSEFRRSELLTAARAVFGRKGFHDASIEEIAEMAEVAKGTVYLYYKSKKDLYLEALRFGLDLLVKQLKARADHPGSCLEILRALAETKIVFFEENGGDVFGNISIQAAHAVARDERDHVVFERDEVIWLHAVSIVAERGGVRTGTCVV